MGEGEVCPQLISSHYILGNSMKLNEVRPTIESSGDLEEQFFSIQDQGMIFDILRNKMYSNPILAICREITCNARDAHREVGTPEIPIHIHLPNYLEKYYKVKDFGPGISPDRMSNIFIKYTASTKRHDNIQTGGFGLGAKTPFSYSDTFSIVTNHNGTQYNYSCFIDETKVGKLSLMSQSLTTEPNGTEIIIPVEQKNYNEFAAWTEQATRHWAVKPVIKGGSITYKTFNKIIAGNNWAIIASKDYNRIGKMIIDEIEYPLDLDTLKKYADPKLIQASKGHFVMYFGVGELSLSASREQIYLDQQTQVAIRNRLDSIAQEIRQQTIDKIESFDNLWKAIQYYRHELRTGFHDLSFLGPMKWKDIRLSDQYLAVNCAVLHYMKGRPGRRYRVVDPNKITRAAYNHLAAEAGAEVYINDLGIKDPSPKHVKKAFDDNPLLKSLQLICPTDQTPIQKLNDDIHLDQMAPKLLSSITKATGRKYTASTSRLLMFKFDPVNGFRQVSYSTIDEDSATHKVLCFLEKGYSTGRTVVLQNGQRLRDDYQVLKSLSKKFTDTSFYGVALDTPKNRIEEDLSDMIEIEDFVQEEVLDSTSIDFVKLTFAAKSLSDIDDALLNKYKKFFSLIENPNSLYIECVNLYNKIKKMGQADSTSASLLSIYEAFGPKIEESDLILFAKNNPDLDVVGMNERIDKRYSLLKHLDKYNYQDLSQEIADYINIVDKNEGNKNV
jgi:hypothetical protein